MANVIDYLSWRGDLSFKEHPYNEIDDLILARFSYLPFHKIRLKKQETIESVAKRLCRLDPKVFCLPKDQLFIKALSNSNRFKKLKISCFSRNKDTAAEVQFAAIAIRLPANKIYVSYMGTDNSVVGWKEDLNLSFMAHTPAQLDGLNYLKKISRRYPLRKILIGGHSKGGNIAIYSALEAPRYIQRRILSVSNYDGPGFNEKIIAGQHDWQIIHRTITYITQGSIFGRILKHPERQAVVYSTGKGIWEHDIYTWEIENDHFVPAKSTARSNIINGTISKWLKKASMDERQVFMDYVYQLVSYASPDGAIDINAKASYWLKKIPNLLKAYTKLSPESRKEMNALLKEFANAYFETTKKPPTHT